MNPATDGNPPALLPVRVELIQPNLDWPAIWKLSRSRGLSSDQTSFLFQLLHQLLPTQNRINRITNEPGLCKLCHTTTEDLHHALVSCPYSRAAADVLLSYVQVAVPGLTSHRLLSLDFGHELEEVELLATLCLISSGLKYIWQARADKKVVSQFMMRAELEAFISILRKTRYGASADRMLEIIV